MADAASRIRTTAAVAAAAAVPLIVTAALGNQALQGWRNSRASSANHWIADLFQPIALTGWRFTPRSGANATAHWLAPLVFDAALVVLTALLATAAAHNRGRIALFLGVWGATTLAGAAAGLLCTPLAYAGVSGMATADTYRDTLAGGLLLGFLIGVLAAIAASVFLGSGSSRSANNTTARAAQADRGLDETRPLST
ncbi:hypothetical protein KGA66_14465 [Actinocrinis puniceicyclus]|uniref:Uncharacterized protein n=1 Tax=Actinocrinis puniceicyclus TaxID=977794 RepID=A0A8J7WRJ6_9ACTN|nr:hypothetical protein [Actinocrinis puniceicyclus]MBS2964260.1 hypothetical protein [Actinocrinis puniceicyclus]